MAGRQRAAELSLAAARVHLEMRILAQAFERDQGTPPAVRLERLAFLGTTILTRLPARHDDRGQRLSGGPGP